MLTNLKIKKLFGLYDYDLAFSTSAEDKVRFITSPNGYGKSTILRLIDGIFNQHLELFFKIPFQELQFIIDNTVLCIKQTIEPVKNGDADDVSDDVTIIFGIGKDSPSVETKLTLNDLVNQKENFNNILQQIEMFFSSERCRFIDDRRLLRENTDASELVRLSEVLKTRLERPDDNTDELLRVFLDIVKRSDFACKHIEISSKFGFRFVADNEMHTKLAMSDLSSGEQHIVMMSLYMLFDAPEKALILIDEPEMSFHLSWQGDYFKNLQQIVALKNIQCIVATHSPHVFNSDWDMSLDLFELSHPIDEE